MIDTHAHIYSDQFANDRTDLIKRAVKHGVKKIFMPNINTESIAGMLALEQAYPDVCYPMMGLHPCEVKADFKERLSDMHTWLDKHRFYAIGEIGMDLHWDISYKAEQIEAFHIQMRWAIDHSLPIVIHSRNANAEVIAELEKYNSQQLHGIFHCFSGSAVEAAKIIELGFHLGIGGVLTFKNSGLDKIVAAIPLEHMVLETDSPYLAPVPYRGQRNEPGYLPYILQKICEIKEVSMAEVDRITTLNAEKIFGVS